MTAYDPLIFGKDKTENVVAIEVDNDSIELFIEHKDGSITNEWRKNQNWILSNKPLDNTWARLKGDLHYRWGKRFNDRDEYIDVKRTMRNKSDLYLVSNDQEATMMLNGITYFKGMKVEDVSVLAFDIETTGLVHDDTSKVLLISNTFLKKGVKIRKLFAYDDYDSDKEFLDAWCEWVREINPSVLVGHNIFGYDLPYLDYFASGCGTALALGRDGSNLKFDQWESKFRVDGAKELHYKRSHVYGRNIIDTLFLSYKYDFSRSYENYKLKYIVAKEGLEVKDRVFYDGDKIRTNYTNPEEWVKIKKYAEHDADDALSLYTLMIAAYFYLTPSVPKTFQQMLYTASGSQINSFLVRSYLQDGHSIAKASEAAQFEGAISFGNPGVYKNVLKVDVASLYPSIMLTYKTYDKMKDPGQHFIKMVAYFTEERLKNKKIAKETGDNYYSGLEQAQKIIINSAYGMMGSTGLNYNSPYNAAFVTRKGREILNQSIEWAQSKDFFVVNADTDSISFNKKTQEPFPKEEQNQLVAELNTKFPASIKWEHDGVFSCVVVIKAKNYILKTESGKVKIKGSALKATNKEKALKELINRLIETFLSDKMNEVQSIYESYVKEIFHIQDISRWVSKKTITDKVLNAARTNEQKVLDAIEDSDYQEGDKCYFYFDMEKNLKLQEHWKNDHDPLVLLKKLYNTLCSFETVLDLNLYPNYALVKNQNLARQLAGVPVVEKKVKPRKLKVETQPAILLDIGRYA